MNYIINPMWFYWVNLIDSVHAISLIIFIVIGVAGLVLLPIWYSDEVYSEEDKKQFFKLLKIYIIVEIVLALIALISPSREVLIQMQLAKYVTYENVEIAYKAIIDMQEYQCSDGHQAGLCQYRKGWHNPA